jgi:CARDB
VRAIIIPGKIRQQTSLALSGPSFSAGGPVTLNLTIGNHGNAYALENHLAVVSNGKAVSQFAGSLVLAGATRQETVTWTGAPAFCICRLKLAGTDRTVTVIRFPVLPVTGALLVVLALARTADALHPRSPAQGRGRGGGRPRRSRGASAR